ncbi:MAG: phosphoribosylanthranilate isomerase [Clostridia bacterium]|nr:phosphoribosylanthranilate isomerase [Clostridia bacterium]
MTKIKICGLSRSQDISFVNEALPDYVGFVFAPSRRRITPQQAKNLKKTLSGSITAVGVFKNSPVQDILNIVNSGIIDIVQLHGEEDFAFVKELKACGCTVIKAICMQQNGIEQKLAEWDNSEADFLLLDNGAGGTGKSFDYSLIGKRGKPFFLAGGLTPQNIVKAAKQVHPYAVDLSSGVETCGVKDRTKIINSVRSIRNYG